MGRAGRMSRGPGAAPLEVQRQEYGELRARGVSNAEACRIVGVNRRTGTRWLFGRSVACPTGGEMHYPPVINYQQTVRSARFLSEEERELICDRLRAGATLRAIGRELGRAASTISREVARNSAEAGVYRAAAAQRLATRGSHALVDVAWAPTWYCAMPFRACSTRRGVPSRSVMHCVNASRASRSASSAMRASIRPSTTATAS